MKKYGIGKLDKAPVKVAKEAKPKDAKDERPKPKRS